MNSAVCRYIASVALACAASVAHADIIFTQSPGSNTGTDNVLFNCSGLATGPALTVQGCLNGSSAIINFTSDENLFANTGQARVFAQDGTFDSLMINLDPLATSSFTSLIFNINTEQGDSGTITIDVKPIGELLVSQSFSIANGQNFFRVDAVNGEAIQYVSFLSSGLGIESVQFDDVRQVRIGGVGSGGNTTTATVPEPATLALLAIPIAFLGMRKRRRAA